MEYVQREPSQRSSQSRRTARATACGTETTSWCGSCVRYRDATTWACTGALNVGQRHEGRARREACTAGG